MSITSFMVDSNFLSLVSKAEKFQTEQNDRNVELALFPKYTDSYIDELEAKLDQLVATYDYYGNTDGDDEIDLSPEFNALDDEDPFITASKVWWGDYSTGIHVYLNLTQRYSTLNDLEVAFDNGLENNLFSKIDVFDQGKNVANVIFNPSGFSVTLFDEFKFVIDGKLPTTISEFEAIDDALSVISDYVDDDISYSRSTLLYHLGVLLNYGADEVFIEAFDNKLFSIFNTDSKVGITLGGLELAVNGSFPEITPAQALDFINYIKNTEDGELGELLGTLNARDDNLTLTNSNGLVIVKLDTHSDQQKLEDELQFVEDGINDGRWVDAVPSDLFSYNQGVDAQTQTNDVGSTQEDSGVSSFKTIMSFSVTHDELIRTANGFQVGDVVLGDVERVKFSDTYIALDIDGATSAGGIYRLYKATFNREPDLGGLSYWIAQADKGIKSAVAMAEDFVWSNEFQELYGITTKDNYGTGSDVSQLVTGFYDNVLGRAPDQGGLNYYSGAIESREKSVGRVLAEISDSPENYAATIDLIENGIQYDLWLG